VYEWRDHEWVNLYQGFHAGYNYGSRKFITDGKIFSFGGYGFWHTHGQVIEFDWKVNDWKLLPYTKDLPIGFAFLQAENNHLCVISNQGNYTISIPDNHVLDNYPALHAPPFMEMNMHADAHAFETDSFLLILRGAPNALIDKKNNNVYIEDAKDNKLMRSMDKNTFVQIRDHDFRIFNPDSGEADTLTREAILDYFKGSEVKPTNTATISRDWLILFGGAIGFTVLSLLYFFKKRRTKNHKGTPDKTEDIPCWSALLQLQGQTISSDQLDEILGIQHIVPNETLRHKRAQCIKQINLASITSFGAPLINRIQDPQDGRRFLYEIMPVVKK
jgi:hypothetical protein